jgi:hypothetical protein
MSRADPNLVLPSNLEEAAVIRLVPRSGSKGTRLLSWHEAHRMANVAAAQAHARLGVDLSGHRVDVVGAIHQARIALMWRPMPHLFGAFINEPGGQPGIIINSGLPRGARTHTAAHELGHARLDHTTSVDDGSTIDTVFADEVDAIPAASRRRAWPEQEKAAEAFASWFLMPRRVVNTSLGVLGLERPASAEDVYRLSLLLGTSYRTTLRHLPNLRLAGAQNCAAWARVAPGTIKARLDRGFAPPSSRQPDVWKITSRFNDLRLNLEPGDRIVLAEHDASDNVPDWLRSVPTVDNSTAIRVLEVDPVAEPQTAMLHGHEGWSVELETGPPPLGLDPRRPQ